MNAEPSDGLAGVGPEAARSAAPAPAGLLYQRRHNCISTLKPGYKLKAIGERQLVDDLEWNEELGILEGEVDEYQHYQDTEGRVWRQGSTDLLELVGRTSTSERKLAFQFRGNVRAFLLYFGRNRCYFCTITDEEGLPPREFGKRWHSFLTNEGRFIVAYIRVLEPQKNGRPHYHFLIAVAWDTEPDRFDWDSFYFANPRKFTHETYAEYRARMRAFRKTQEFKDATKRYVDSAPEKTRWIWSLFRRVLPRKRNGKGYGLGRAETLPIRKGEGQVSEYVSKYLESGLKLRRHEWKGCRRVEYSRKHAGEWKKFGRQFSWITPNAMQWRRRVKAIAAVVSARNLDEMSVRFGKRWAYRLREPIITLGEPEFAEWVKTVGTQCILGKARPDPLKPPLWWLRANPEHTIAQRFLEANPHLRQPIGNTPNRPGAGVLLLN